MGEYGTEPLRVSKLMLFSVALLGSNIFFLGLPCHKVKALVWL